MRPTLRTIIVSSALCLVLTSGSALLAQDSSNSTNSTEAQSGQQMHHGGMHGPMSPDEELSHLTKNLDLTSNQQSQIKPILQDRHDQLMQMHQDASMSRQDRMVKMKSLDEESNSKLQALLNDQQKTKYQKMIADRKQRMQEMRAAHGNGEQSLTSSEAKPQ